MESLSIIFSGKASSGLVKYPPELVPMSIMSLGDPKSAGRTCQLLRLKLYSTRNSERAESQTDFPQGRRGVEEDIGCTVFILPVIAGQESQSSAGLPGPDVAKRVEGHNVITPVAKTPSSPKCSITMHWFCTNLLLYENGIIMGWIMDGWSHILDNLLGWQRSPTVVLKDNAHEWWVMNLWPLTNKRPLCLTIDHSQ
jgi:hypothetical protein